MTKEKFSQYASLLDRTARKVKQYAQSSFDQQSFDLTVDQWAILKVLRQHPSLTNKEVAAQCGKDQPTSTRIVDLLIKKDLVLREVDPQDRRSLRLCLTDKGRQQVLALSPQVAIIREKAWENLTEHDFEHFSRILNTIYNNLNGTDD